MRDARLRRNGRAKKSAGMSPVRAAAAKNIRGAAGNKKRGACGTRFTLFKTFNNSPCSLGSIQKVKKNGRPVGRSFYPIPGKFPVPLVSRDTRCGDVVAVFVVRRRRDIIAGTQLDDAIFKFRQILRGVPGIDDEPGRFQ